MGSSSYADRPFSSGNAETGLFCGKSIFKAVGIKVLVLRISVTICLLCAAVVCGTVSYSELRRQETESFEDQYKSMAEQALSSLQDDFEIVYDQLQTISSTMSYAHPDPAEYPFVTLDGFFTTITKLSRSSKLGLVTFQPIVLPEELPVFNDFMQNFFASEPQYSHLSNISVWAIDVSTLYPYDDTTGVSMFSSKTFLTPVLQQAVSNLVGTTFMGFNTHAHPQLAGTIDAAFDCAAAKGVAAANENCMVVSPMVAYPLANPLDPSPTITDIQIAFATPIVLANTTTSASTVVANMGTTLSWVNILTGQVPTFAGDLDFVVSSIGSTGTAETVTFTVRSGIPSLTGFGDLHDSAFEDQKLERILTIPGDNDDFVEVNYKVQVYPTQNFYNGYATNNPLNVGLFFGAVIMFCLFMFFLYDMLLIRAFEQKDNILDTKRRFVRFTSHEVRTPLNTIRLGLNLFEIELVKIQELLRNSPTGEVLPFIMTTLDSWTYLLSDIFQNSEMAVNVLNDLLDYDKVELGTMRLEYSLVNVWEILKRTTSLMQIQAKQKDITLVLDLNIEDGTNNTDNNNNNNNNSSIGKLFSQHDPPNCVVVGDVSRLNQVLRNLISNALKFTPNEGSVKLTVEWVADDLSNQVIHSHSQAEEERLLELQRHTSRNGSVRISVHDSGVGLSEEQLASIGAEGVQFNVSQLLAGQGSGLGLFISKGIVEQHGGVMTVASEGLGRGSKFTIDLPLYIRTTSSSSDPLVAISPSQQRQLKPQLQPKESSPRSSRSLRGSFRARRLDNGKAVKTIMVTAGSSAAATAVAGAMRETVKVVPAAEEGPLLPTTANHEHPELYSGASSSSSLVDSINTFNTSLPASSCSTSSNNNNNNNNNINSGVVDKKHVLVVDDSHFNRKMLCRLLTTTKHYVCSQAEDGRQAVQKYEESLLEAYEAQPIDMVLMDFEMPVMNGPTATKKLRELGFQKLIIGVTGNVLPADVDYFKAQGANAVLFKPFQMSSFTAIINDYQHDYLLYGQENLPQKKQQASSASERELDQPAFSLHNVV